MRFPLPLDKIDIQGKVGLYLENIISEQLKNDARNKLLDLKKGKFIVKRTSLIKVEEKIGCDDIIRCQTSQVHFALPNFYTFLFT